MIISEIFVTESFCFVLQFYPCFRFGFSLTFLLDYLCCLEGKYGIGEANGGFFFLPTVGCSGKERTLRRARFVSIRQSNLHLNLAFNIHKIHVL